MVRIVFGDFQVNEISNSSGIFSGVNRQALWKHSAKQNEGFGSVGGDGNEIQFNTNVTDDRDIIDTGQWGGKKE